MFATKTYLTLTVSLAFMALPGCSQELPKEVAQDAVFGTVQDLKTVDNEKMLVYVKGQDPKQKNWGLAGGYYITVDGQAYAVHWDEAAKFKALKQGDKVNLHPSEYIACTGETDLKPTCRRLMRIYKSESRVDPLQSK